MAQNAEHQNLDRKLNAERDTERIAGTVETVGESGSGEKDGDSTDNDEDGRDVEANDNDTENSRGDLEDSRGEHENGRGLCTKITVTHIKRTAGRFCTL
jgi:hypothetical protein